MITAVSSSYRPVDMEDAVGYPSLDCTHQTAAENALVLKNDRLFMLVDTHGDITPPGHCGLGLFHDDTRILSHYELRLAGGPASLLSGRADRMHHAQIDLAISDAVFGSRRWDAANGIHVRRELFLEDRLIERLTLTSYLETAVDFHVELHLGADFADVFEVRGWSRAERGQHFEPVPGDASIAFPYRGRDGAMLLSTIRFGTAPTQLLNRIAVWRMRLEPHQAVPLLWEVLPPGVDSAPRAVDATRARLDSACSQWESDCARWSTDVEDFNVTLRQAVADLGALYSRVDGEPVVTAGIPWYGTAFGRDSIITSLQTLPLNSRIAVDTLRYLAHRQGQKEDLFTEEQPGRIMHELRRGEMARNGEIPHTPYYGTIDATPLWLVLLHETWMWTGDRALVEELLPHAERALSWLERYGDPDGDGFLEYSRTSDRGLVNQGWKDSWNGVPFPDGALPDPPIALVEVQGYACDAQARMAQLFDAFGRKAQARRLRARATDLRQKIHDRFWVEHLGTFALALDGAKRRIETATSNAGHLLWSRVPSREQAERMAWHFAADDMFSAWGLRTLSSRHPVYNPMSYHNGSIWPHDNALVMLGLSHYGHARQALMVFDALYEAAIAMPNHRLPELFCGMARRHAPGPVLYPVSCSPQAWASGAFFMLLQGCLGLQPDAPARCFRLRHPRLPSFVDEIRLDGLQIGRTRLSFQFVRHGDRTSANLLDVEGEPLDVRIELS